METRTQTDSELKKGYMMLTELERKFGLQIKNRRLATRALAQIISKKRMRVFDTVGDEVIARFLSDYLKRMYPENKRIQAQISDFLKSNDYLGKVFRSLDLPFIKKHTAFLPNENRDTIGKNRDEKVEATILEYIVGVIKVSSSREEAVKFLRRNIYMGGVNFPKEIETMMIKFLSREAVTHKRIKNGRLRPKYVSKRPENTN